MRKIVSEGRIVPSGYGLAYYDFCNMVKICYPIPLHLIIRVLREFYWWIVSGCWKSKYEREIHKAENRGFERGNNLTLKLSVPPEIKIKYLKRGLEMMCKAYDKSPEEIDDLWKKAIDEKKD